MAAGEGSPAAYLLFVGAALRFLAGTAHEVANDPARPDFESRTQLRPKRLHAGYLTTEHPLETAALALALAAEDAEAHLSAHLRAFERLQGAAVGQLPKVAPERAREAVDFARRSATALRVAAGRSSEFAERIREDPGFHAARRSTEAPLPYPLECLPPETLALLYLGGLRMSELRELLRPRLDAPGDVTAEQFGTMSVTIDAFANDLAGWRPPSDAVFEV